MKQKEQKIELLSKSLQSFWLVWFVRLGHANLCAERQNWRTQAKLKKTWHLIKRWSSIVSMMITLFSEKRGSGERVSKVRIMSYVKDIGARKGALISIVSCWCICIYNVCILSLLFYYQHVSWFTYCLFYYNTFF